MSTEEKDMVSVTLEVPREYYEKMAAEGGDPKERILGLIREGCENTKYMDDPYGTMINILEGTVERLADDCAPLLAKMIVDDIVMSMTDDDVPCTVNLRMTLQDAVKAHEDYYNYNNTIRKLIETIAIEPPEHTMVEARIHLEDDE